MQKDIAMLRLILITVALLLPASTVLASAPPQLLLTTQIWPPYQNYQNGKISGTAIERVQCALGAMNQPYKITFTNWSNAQLLVKNGDQHAFFSGNKAASRDKFAVFSEPVEYQTRTWYFATGITPEITEEKKHSLEFSAKYNTSKWLWLKRNDFNIAKKPRNAEVLLDMLKKHEIDVALETSEVFNYELEQQGLPSYYFNSIPLAKSPLGVYFSKSFVRDYPGFLDRFNLAVKVCKGDA